MLWARMHLMDMAVETLRYKGQLITDAEEEAVSYSYPCYMILGTAHSLMHWNR